MVVGKIINQFENVFNVCWCKGLQSWKF